MNRNSLVCMVYSIACLIASMFSNLWGHTVFTSPSPLSDLSACIRLSTLVLFFFGLSHHRTISLSPSLAVVVCRVQATIEASTPVPISFEQAVTWACSAALRANEAWCRQGHVYVWCWVGFLGCFFGGVRGVFGVVLGYFGV